MRKLMLIVSAAALTATMPALAKEQGNGNGKGNGNAERSQGGGNGNGRGNGNARADRKDDRRAERPARQAERRNDRAEQRQERNVRQAVRDQDRTVRDVRDARRVIREVRNDPAQSRDWSRWAERRDRDGDDRYEDRSAFWRDGRPLRVAGYDRGCPPGLAKKNSFCLPPGQLRRAQFIGQRVPFAQTAYNVPERYRYRFQDGGGFNYRYNEGFIYELNQRSNLVSRVIPLFATNLMVGEALPLGYETYNLPTQYRSYYQDNDDYLYRYDDNAIYRTNARSGLIEGIVALLAGGGGLGGLGNLAGGLGGAAGGLGGIADLAGFGVGQRMPSGYDAYNLPMNYRDQYYDSDQAQYRYADGNIYQVNPRTQLIQSVISLLT